MSLVELGRVQDSIRLGVGGTVARHLSRPSAWLELPLATADACGASSSKRGYTITRILAGELECSSRCGKRDRRSSVVIDEFARMTGGGDESSTRRGGAVGASRATTHVNSCWPNCRSRSDGWSWPASPPPCWRAGTDRRCFCCMAQESSRPYGHE